MILKKYVWITTKIANSEICFKKKVGFQWVRVRVMVFKATFNNISVISWLSVLLVEET
jgi:hypothetical protein